ncbi:MAG: CBS domain-containing protein [Acidimicrobiia bacterium]
MSARAAWRLEAIGFGRVYDYRPGKKDWLANGLPTEGNRSDQKRIGDVARSDFPTCLTTDTVGEVRRRIGLPRQCVVVNEANIVEGRIGRLALTDARDDDPIEELMELGPTTVRPDASIESVARRLVDSHADSILVTTDLGELLGVLTSEDAVPHLGEA